MTAERRCDAVSYEDCRKEEEHGAAGETTR